MFRSPLRDPCEPICYQRLHLDEQCGTDICSSFIQLLFRFPPLRQWMVIFNFLRIISSQEVLQTSLGDGRNNIKQFSQLCKEFTLIDVSFFKKMHRTMLMPLLASFHVRRKHGEVWWIAFAAVNYVFRTPKKTLGPFSTQSWRLLTQNCPSPWWTEHWIIFQNSGTYKEIRYVSFISCVLIIYFPLLGYDVCSSSK